MSLSGMDALEDLDFDSHTTRDAGAAAGWPPASKPVKLANNILELASSTPLHLLNLVKSIELENTANQTFFDTSPASKPLRIHKEHCVFLI
jgi:hypothetical protein